MNAHPVNVAAFFGLGAGPVARLRAEAARIDAEFAEQERRAEANLQAARMRRTINASERVLTSPPKPALSPCLHCLETPVRR